MAITPRVFEYETGKEGRQWVSYKKTDAITQAECGNKFGGLRFSPGKHCLMCGRAWDWPHNGPKNLTCYNSPINTERW
jgi:hypothetical protein